MKKSLIVMTVAGLVLCVVGLVLTMVQLAETNYVSEDVYAKEMGFSTVKQTLHVAADKGPLTMDQRLWDMPGFYLTVDNKLADDEVKVWGTYDSTEQFKNAFHLDDGYRLNVSDDVYATDIGMESPQMVKKILIKAAQLYKEKRMIGSLQAGVHVMVNQKNYDRLMEETDEAQGTYEDGEGDGDGDFEEDSYYMNACIPGVVPGV